MAFMNYFLIICHTAKTEKRLIEVKTSGLRADLLIM